MDAFLIDAESLAARADALWTLSGTLILASRTVAQLEALASGNGGKPPLQQGALAVLPLLTATGLIEALRTLPPQPAHQRLAPVALDEQLELQLIRAPGIPATAPPDSIWALTDEEREIMQIAQRERAVILTLSQLLLRKIRLSQFRVEAADLRPRLLPVRDYESFLALSDREILAALTGDARSLATPAPAEAKTPEHS